MNHWSIYIFLSATLAACSMNGGSSSLLHVVQDDEAQTLSVFREGSATPLLVQNAAADHRPFLHPIMTPDGLTETTQYSPGHHPHQTGLYWGFTRVNGRDYFHNPQGDYWRRDTTFITEAEGQEVSWATVYDLLDAEGMSVLTETQQWTMSATEDTLMLDLEWRGEAHTEVTIGEYDYGGLFLRMPWHPEVRGQAVNAARQRNHFAEGKRAMWLDVGMELEGREDFGHFAIFDHPENDGFPLPWRVDGQLGVGPVRARMGDWIIPEGSGAVVRHRLLAYTGELDDLEMRKQWEAYVGREGQIYSTTSLWGIAQQEAMEAAYLSPDEAAAAMTLPPGYSVTAWAGEPMLTQPMAFAWDDKGRLWVAENRDYESRATGFSGSGDSRIVILEDTDRDGKADVRKVFLEGIAFPAALAVGFEGVFVGAPPHLLFVPDRDKDDRADLSEVEVLLTGWGIRDRHETINSLHWGPDGWLYGLEGFATESVIRKPEPGAAMYRGGDTFPEDLLEGEGVDINGGVWRYHPTKKRFEVVAHGFSNPWGIDYDAHGQLFISACVIPHLFHVIPGGIYQRQGGQHFNPYIYQDIGPIVDHRHRSAHGGARIYQSDAFPVEEHGRVFMANIHEHAVLSDILNVDGSGFVASHGDDFMLANNAQWVGFSMEIGPEGGLYVLDWHDADICGGDVHDKDTGRIFRIVPEQSMADEWEGRYDDMDLLSDLELARLQESPSDWHARRARVLLQYRATQRQIDSGAEDLLMGMFEDEAPTTVRLKAMWSLHVTGLLTAEMLFETTEDKDEYIRAWAIQLALEDGQPDEPLSTRLVRMARRDKSPVVRKYLAAALQRVESELILEMASGLVRHEEDADDHNLPVLLWTGIETIAEADPERSLEIAELSRIPTITRNIGRRLVDANMIGAAVSSLESMRTEVQELMLEGILSGLEGRRDVERPEEWEAVAASLSDESRLQFLVEQVTLSFSDSEAMRGLVADLLRDGEDIEVRRMALRRLASHQEPIEEILMTLLDHPELQLEAIRAVASYNDTELGLRLLEMYDDLDEPQKEAVIQTLAARPASGWMLTEAIKSEAIPRSAISPYVARQMRRVVGSGFVEIWGPIDQLPGDKDVLEARYRELVTAEAVAEADPYHGRDVFLNACGVCHQMYGEGSVVAPDLTGSNRTSLDYILSNVIRPGEEIQDDYRMVIITMRDGRTHVGSIAQETERTLTVRPVGQPAEVLSRGEIQSVEVSNMSLMPEGLFEPLSEQEILDLFAYLNTPGPLDSQ